MIVEILNACVRGPFQVQYLHPASLKWVSTSWRGVHEKLEDAVERTKDITHNSRVLDPTGGVVCQFKRS